MFVMKVLGVLLLHVASVTPDTQICQDPEKNAYSIITCGAPGKDGIPGIDGKNGKKGQKGEPGPRGYEGPQGRPGDCVGSVCADLQKNINILNEQVKELQTITAFSFSKGRATSGNKVYLSDGGQGSFEEAKSRCANAGGQLATPRNANDNLAIQSITTQFGVYAYLGMKEDTSTRRPNNPKGLFKYLSGGEISYANWDNGEPNNFNDISEECTEMRITGKWNDCVCEPSRLIICEFHFTRN